MVLRGVCARTSLAPPRRQRRDRARPARPLRRDAAPASGLSSPYVDGLAGVEGRRTRRRRHRRGVPVPLCRARVDGRRDGLLEHLGTRRHPGLGAIRTQPPSIQRLPRRREVSTRHRALYGELLTLPLYAELPDEDVDRVVASRDEPSWSCLSERRRPLLVLGTTAFAAEIADVATSAGHDVVGFVENLDRSRCACRSTADPCIGSTTWVSSRSSTTGSAGSGRRGEASSRTRPPSAAFGSRPFSIRRRTFRATSTSAKARSRCRRRGGAHARDRPPRHAESRLPRRPSHGDR